MFHKLTKWAEQDERVDSGSRSPRLTRSHGQKKRFNSHNRYKGVFVIPDISGQEDGDIFLDGGNRIFKIGKVQS
ncbi:MAG: hypothetical protein M3R25_03950 [Bacteroidota bacterium]|nr:hypothetical protein [Bacteroidota bacterium]